MSKLLSLLVLVFFSVTAFTQDYSRVKVFANDQDLYRLGQLGVTVDHGFHKEGVFFISDFSKAEIDIMKQHEFDYEILIEDVQAYYIERLKNPEIPTKNTTCTSTNGGGNSSYANPTTPTNFNLGTMGGYLKYNEMLAELDAMVAQFPNLITAKAPISTFVTANNRPIYHVIISDNPSTDEANEPRILYTAIHHAREPMALMETIFYMWYLLENYATNDEVKYLVNNTQMYFVPCLNPDGYVYNETTNPNGGGMWRKNRRNNGNNVFGVDLNRNYSYGWGTTGTSTSTSNDTYCGTAPFSEPETQAMRWLVQNKRFTHAFNAHTYAEDILFPIGTTTAEFAPHHDYMQDYSIHMVQFNGYTAMKSSGLYPASGDSDDYMYKVDLGVGQKDTIFAHTPEVGTDFWQPSSEIIATCKEMLFPNLVLAHLSRNYSVVTDTDASEIGSFTGNFNHSIKRLGREAGPVTVSIEPLLNVVSVGNPVVYNLNQRQQLTGAISYTLNPNLQFGDLVKYILKTDNGLWIKRDTIVKTFGVITLQTSENATTTTNWTGNWSTTTSTFVSPSRSFTDSPSGNYANNANTTYSYTQTIDLTNAVAAKITYYAKWDIEADYDMVQFQVSTNNGTSWIPQCGNYTVGGSGINGSAQPLNQPLYEGTQTNWVLETINLSDYFGQQIKVRFLLKADNATRKDGFYFDDFKVFINNQAAPQAPVASFTPSSSSVCASNTITFNDFSTNIPTSWAWDFGDGYTSNQQNPTHSYSNPGTYTVTLTVTNANGTDNTSSSITVNAIPVVSLTSSDADNTVCNNQGLVNLTVSPAQATVTGNGVTGLNFDPSIVSIGLQSIMATYTDPNGCTGGFELNLVVENCSGIAGNEELPVKLMPNPNKGSFVLQNADLASNFQVIDGTGKEIYKGKIEQFNQNVQLSNASQGVYFIVFEFNGIARKIKFVVL